MKKFALLLTLLLVFSFATVAQDEDPIEIDFVHIFSDDIRPGVVEAIIEAFEAENPGIVVNAFSTNSDSNYEETFNSALLAADQGDAPNILQVESGLTQLAIDSGYFVPVSDVASEEQLASLEDILPPIRAAYDFGEITWALPWNISNPVLYINRGMFEAAGLDPDDPPQTFEEVTAACEAIMGVAELELSGCINWPMDSWFPEQWMAMQNVLIADNGNGREARATEALFDSPEMIEMMTWWAELGEAGYFTYSGTAGSAAYNPEGIAFLSGQTAMMINSTAGLTLILNFGTAQGIEVGVAPLFKPFEDANNGMTTGGAGVWLSADQSEEELQAANDFIFFLTNPENSALWHQGSGYVPIRASSVDLLEEQGWFEENPFFRIAVTQMEESESNLATAGAVFGPSVEVRGYLISAFQSVIDSGVSPEEALTAAAEQANAELEGYNEFFE